MDLLLLGLRILLSAVFVLAGAAKFLDLQGTRRSMRDLGVARPLVAILAIALPPFEIASGVALMPVLTAWWGAVSTLALLVLFTAVISINLAQGKKPPCHCFGQLSSRESSVTAAPSRFVKESAGAGAPTGKPSAFTAPSPAISLDGLQSREKAAVLTHYVEQQPELEQR